MIDAMKQAFKTVYGHEPTEDSFLWAGFQEGYRAAIEAAEKQEPLAGLLPEQVASLYANGIPLYTLPQPAIPEWQPIDVPLYYNTRCADGTIFLNAVQMPAHAVEWCIAAAPKPENSHD